MTDTFDLVDDYIDALFVGTDPHLDAALADARASGLPDIQVSAGQGKFMYLLAKLAGARRILELGTLGGYSTIWLARALPADGRLVTLELDPHHAEVAVRSLARAGLADKVEIVVGVARDTLPGVIDKADAPFDLVFLDADKVSYATYLAEIMRRVRSGSLILADNVIRRGKVLYPSAEDPSAVAVRDFNEKIATDPKARIDRDPANRPQRTRRPGDRAGQMRVGRSSDPNVCTAADFRRARTPAFSGPASMNGRF